jgi:hypothetical protein
MGNGGQKGQLSLAQKVHAYASGRFGQQVGRGDCYDLADHALKHAGAKSAPNFGKITKNANYIWGKEIKLIDARSGDILQLRKHKIKIITVKKTKKSYKKGGWDEEEKTSERDYKRGHHTAIVAENKGNGVFIIFEQHVRPPGESVVSKKVQRNTIYVTEIKNGPKKTVQMQGGVKIEVTTITTIKVTGKMWAYRALP